ncbi:MAG TPA: TonB-dependent receptor, partial [Thermoanaerobaculia bacterium]|nr:TonB-dependent receptor [Thermoanaerobaculia bacterium]
ASLPNLGRRVAVSPAGEFRFDDLPAGEHVVVVDSPSAGRAVRTVVVPAGEVASIELTLSRARHTEEIVVTGTAEARSALDLASATNVLRGEELQLRLQASLGETLESEPGITSSFFGPGASRPIVRGQSGDRIRVLEGGIGVGDASAISPDHAVTSDPSLAEQIEVLRGPATLLYGSSAIGGAVNIVDNRIPRYRPTERIGGILDLRGGTVDDQRSGAVGLEGGQGRFAWSLGALLRETDDYEVPGFARLEGDEHEEEEHHEEDGEEEEEEPFGFVPNTDSKTQSLRAGGTYFFGNAGFLGVSVTGFDTEYGIPIGGHGHEEGHGDEGEEEHEEEEHGEEIRIDMQQRRFDLRGERTKPFGAFRGFKVRLGVTDYEHVELEDGEVGTTFFNELAEARFELVQKQRGRSNGSIGLQLYERNLNAIGAEAFLPETDTSRWAVFTFQELRAGSLRWQLGARFEAQENDPRVAKLSAVDHDGLSGSLGLVWDVSESWSFAASAARAVKMPAPEELFSDGAHVATQSFEIGDPTLGEESALGLDVSLRRTKGKLTGELTLFRNDFEDYIYPAFTGEEEDGFPVVLYTQEDADFVGAELKARVELLERNGHHLHLRMFGDTVEAELASGGNLPRIPSARLGAGFDYHGKRLNAMVEVRHVFDQDDVAVNETPTDGYTMVNASVGYRFVFGSQLLDVLLRGRNLTDEEARSHTSYLKEVAPLPGRDVSLSMRLWF